MTACSNEAVLRTVAIRAPAVFGVHSALDLYTHLKSLEVHAEEVEEEQDEEQQEDSKRCFLISTVFCMQAPHSCCLIQSWPHAKMRCFRPPRTALALTWPCY